MEVKCSIEYNRGSPTDKICTAFRKDLAEKTNLWRWNKDVCRLVIKLLRVKGSDEERKLLNDLMSTSEGIKKVFDITVTFQTITER